MSIASAAKIELISQAKDKRRAIIDAVGSLDGVEVAADLVMLGVYIQDEMTRGGIIKPKDVLKEDEYQGKVGLVLKRGQYAYGDWEADEDKGCMAQLHSWVVFAIKDTLPFQWNGVAVKFIPYDKIRMRIPDPKMVF